MALDRSRFDFVETGSFEDEDGTKFMGVALVGETGEQAGTLQSPVNVQASDTFDRILTELRIMNLHLAQITDQDFSEEDF